MNTTGPQYAPDDPFKTAARLHQSRYRAEVLDTDCSEYGNRLTDADARALLNYYGALGVREALRRRYPEYSVRRDADMLRSEHIPFNLLAPLAAKPEVARTILQGLFGVHLTGPIDMKIEWAPEPNTLYLHDLTSFDTYLQGIDASGRTVGVGIEVKYTEREYKVGKSEAKRVADPESTYWKTTRESGHFRETNLQDLSQDTLRQIWRNHLLGLSMVRREDIDRFVSVTLYPDGNEHIAKALKRYREFLNEDARGSVISCTYESYVDRLQGDAEIEKWKEYLKARYVFIPQPQVPP